MICLISAKNDHQQGGIIRDCVFDALNLKECDYNFHYNVVEKRQGGFKDIKRRNLTFERLCVCDSDYCNRCVLLQASVNVYFYINVLFTLQYFAKSFFANPSF